jgi:hypothetical protein
MPHSRREYALLGLGYVFLSLCVSSLLAPGYTEANLPLFFIPTPNLKNLRGFGAAITLGALGVMLLHQEKVGAPRLTVGALCALSTYIGMAAYLGFPHYALAMAPLGGLALVLYLQRRLCSSPPLPPAPYAIRSYVCLAWGLCTLGLTALALVDGGKTAVRVLRTLKPSQDEGAAFLSAFASLGALATHTSLSQPSAAASVLCSAATAAVAYAFVALTHNNAHVRANTWYLVGFYILWAALGMAENLGIKRAASALVSKKAAQALAAATAAFVEKEAAKKKKNPSGVEEKAGGEKAEEEAVAEEKEEEEDEGDLDDEGEEGEELENEEEDEDAKKDQ